MENTTIVPSQKRWHETHAQKIIALFFWVILLSSYQWYAYSYQLSPLQVLQQLLAFLTDSFWGPLLYILLYAIRPLILFPSTPLTLAGGFIFGPVWGVLYTILASNSSAMVAYFVGRYFGQGLLPDGAYGNFVQRYATRLRQNSFETILIMRFIFMPYDLVNYFAGFLQIRWLPFILATALGSIPGTIAFIGFGASIERFDGAIPSLNPTTLTASMVIFVISLLLARIFKKREGISK
ncbi:MAG: TVP38/TMEM64 family protein [Chloroflexi bacterium]|nr:TVP38/TMEM64 family protein [Chloroflexota bacterium]